MRDAGRGDSTERRQDRFNWMSVSRHDLRCIKNQWIHPEDSVQYEAKVFDFLKTRINPASAATSIPTESGQRFTG